MAILLVFATSGTTKLANVPEFRETLVGFGVPFRLTRPTARLLPATELLIALALLFQPTARWAAACAALLLVLFITAIAVALRQGKTIDCNCFGQLSAEQVGPRTLVRNVILVCVSILIAWKAPGSALTAWTTSPAAANLVATVAVICAAALLIMLRLRQAPQSLVVEPLAEPTAGAIIAPGVRVPDFALEATDGSSVALGDLLARGRPTILVFASPLCHTCHDLVLEIGRWSVAMADSLTFAVVESVVGDVGELAAGLQAPDELTVLVEGDREVASRYGMDTIPAGLAISPAGLPLGPPATGPVEIEQMVRVILQGLPQPASQDRA